MPKVAGTTPIGAVQSRQRVRIAGRVHSVRVPTRTATANLECTLADGTGSILLVFQGRRQVPGLKQGARLVAEGMVGAWNGRRAMLNPDYELLAGADVVASGQSKSQSKPQSKSPTKAPTKPPTKPTPKP